MAVNSKPVQVERLRANQKAILEMWIAQQKALGAARSELISDADLGRQCSDVLSAFLDGLASGVTDVSQPAWERIRTILRGISVSRARAGWSPSETVLFVY